MTATAPGTQSMATRPPTASACKPRLRRLSEFVYLCESSSRPGTGHTVNIATGRCSCTAGQFNKRCSHLALAAQFGRGVQALRDQAERQRRAARASGAVAGIDAHLAESERLLEVARRALADCHPQSDEYAGLLRAVDQSERAMAALDAAAVRAA